MEYMSPACGLVVLHINSLSLSLGACVGCVCDCVGVYDVRISIWRIQMAAGGGVSTFSSVRSRRFADRSNSSLRCLLCCVHIVALVLVRPVAGHECERARCRVARKILDSELYTKVVPLPCPPFCAHVARHCSNPAKMDQNANSTQANKNLHHTDTDTSRQTRTHTLTHSPTPRHTHTYTQKSIHPRTHTTRTSPYSRALSLTKHRENGQ